MKRISGSTVTPRATRGPWGQRGSRCGDDLVAFGDALDDLIKPVIDLGADG